MKAKHFSSLAQNPRGTAARLVATRSRHRPRSGLAGFRSAGPWQCVRCSAAPGTHSCARAGIFHPAIGKQITVLNPLLRFAWPLTIRGLPAAACTVPTMASWKRSSVVAGLPFPPGAHGAGWHNELIIIQHRLLAYRAGGAQRHKMVCFV